MRGPTGPSPGTIIRYQGNPLRGPAAPVSAGWGDRGRSGEASVGDPTPRPGAMAPLSSWTRGQGQGSTGAEHGARSEMPQTATAIWPQVQVGAHSPGLEGPNYSGVCPHPGDSGHRSGRGPESDGERYSQHLSEGSRSHERALERRCYAVPTRGHRQGESPSTAAAQHPMRYRQ